MPELRGPASDEPDDKPAESRVSDAERIRELDAIGQTKAFDVSRPVYNPLDHIRPGDREPVEQPGDRPAVAPPPLADRPRLHSLADRVHAAREDRYGAQDAPPGPTASADAEATPEADLSDAERLAGAVGGDDAEGSPDATQDDDRPREIEDPERWALERAREMQDAVPEGSRGRITMGAGHGFDESGGGRMVIGTSEPNGYLRPGVELKPGEERAMGDGHAETSILDYMEENRISPTHVGAGRPICDPCADRIEEAGAKPASELKNPNRARENDGDQT